jgi:hypothetical protein
MHRYKRLLNVCRVFGLGNAVSTGKSADSTNDEQQRVGTLCDCNLFLAIT